MKSRPSKVPAPETGAETPETAPGNGNGQHRLLTAADILNADDVRTERVHVPEWGGDVLVRTVTMAQRTAWLKSLPDGKVDEEQVQAQMLALMLVDEAGHLLFSAAQLQALGAKSASAIDRIMAAVRVVDDWTAELEAAGKD